jgi:hypothetical protein
LFCSGKASFASGWLFEEDLGHFYQAMGQSFLRVFHSEMGRVLIGLLEGFLMGFEAIPLRKQIMVALKRLDGLKGIRFGPSLNPKFAGCFKLGVSLKPKSPGHFKPSCKAQVLSSIAFLLVGSPEVFVEWISSSTLELAMVLCDDPPVSMVRQGALVITDVEPGLGVSFRAIDVGSRSSSEVQQFFPVCFPIPPVVASLS